MLQSMSGHLPQINCLLAFLAVPVVATYIHSHSLTSFDPITFVMSKKMGKSTYQPLCGMVPDASSKQVAITVLHGSVPVSLKDLETWK